MHRVVLVPIAIEFISHYYSPVSFESIGSSLKVAFALKEAVGNILVCNAKVV
jgi:hypothetical protein